MNKKNELYTMINFTERLGLKNNKKQKSENSLNSSFSSNNSFYEKLNDETKKDIIFLIESGYDKKMIIKLYIFVKPSNVNEAIHYLTKENGIYQHIFYSSKNNKDFCEICREPRDMHINFIDTSYSNISFNHNISLRNEKLDILRIKPVQKKFICKICEEEILEEKNKTECKLCYNYFCNDCLYSYIKEAIRNGKYVIKCPENDCDSILTKEILDKILLFNKSSNAEINNLKNLFEKNKTKDVVLSNPDLMFCPVVNCGGYCNKKSYKNFNICSMGHKFCPTCGELYHEDGKCKDAEKVDELFEHFYKKYKLKKCPYCQVVTLKNGGCNHIICSFCGKNWCWLCNQLFKTTQEHYGNMQSKCYDKMMNNNQNLIICSKCGNGTDNYRDFYNCHHIICNDCFENYLLENNILIIFPPKILDCPMTDCNNFRLFSSDYLLRYIKETNNEDLIKKYRPSFLIYQYFTLPFFPNEYYELYFKLILDLLDNIARILYNKFSDCKGYDVFEIIGIIFAFIIVGIYIIAIPIFPHLAIKKLYYYKLIKELRSDHYNIILLILIIVGEEILFLVLIFPLMIMNYLYYIIFFPILILSDFIRKKIYE